MSNATGTNPDRNLAGASASSTMEIPTAPQNLTSFVNGEVFSGKIDLVMREKRLAAVREFILRHMNKIVVDTAMENTDDYHYYFELPFLREEIDKHSLGIECYYLNRKLQKEFAEKGWKLYIKLSEAVNQSLDWKFWKNERRVRMYTILELRLV